MLALQWMLGRGGKL